MKNRAKCKLCNSIIESLSELDYVTCKCGEIALDGGDRMQVYANDLNNIIRVDDLGNEILVTVKDPDVKPLDIDTKPSRKDLIKMLDEMANNIENLPSYAKQTPVNQYDLLSLISLLSLILKS